MRNLALVSFQWLLITIIIAKLANCFTVILFSTSHTTEFSRFILQTEIYTSKMRIINGANSLYCQTYASGAESISLIEMTAEGSLGTYDPNADYVSTSHYNSKPLRI